MLYLYDRALSDDIRDSINSDNANPNVFIADADTYPQILAQIQNDTITYPLILISRDDDMPIITELFNFSRAQFGIPAAFDNKKNIIYNEKALPIDVKYTIRILATNTADVDELSRELFYKYISMYFLTIRLPYESDRKIRFGIQVDLDYGIKRESGNFEYLKSGALYQSTIHLNTNGCVFLSYIGRHLQRQVLDNSINIIPPTGDETID